jgi:hypothetical protein
MDFVTHRFNSITSFNVQSQEILNMLNKHKLQRIAIATSALMAFGTTQLIANAETVTITGTIQGPTCVLSTSSGGGETKNFNIALPTVQLSAATSGPAGTAFGTKSFVTFALTQNGTTPCSFGGNATGWDVAIAPAKSGFLKTIGTSTFLSNMTSVADGGTNAVVKLTGGVAPGAATVANATNEITLSDTGAEVYVSSPTVANAFKALATSSIVLGAEFVNPTGGVKPNSGTYNSTLTVGVTYR